MSLYKQKEKRINFKFSHKEKHHRVYVFVWWVQIFVNFILQPPQPMWQCYYLINYFMLRRLMKNELLHFKQVESPNLFMLIYCDTFCVNMSWKRDNHTLSKHSFLLMWENKIQEGKIVWLIVIQTIKQCASSWHKKKSTFFSVCHFFTSSLLASQRLWGQDK